jgi:hypothetical protein
MKKEQGPCHGGGELTMRNDILRIKALWRHGRTGAMCAAAFDWNETLQSARWWAAAWSRNSECVRILNLVRDFAGAIERRNTDFTDFHRLPSAAWPQPNETTGFHEIFTRLSKIQGNLVKSREISWLHAEV